VVMAVAERTVRFHTPLDDPDAVYVALASLWDERADVVEMDRMMFDTALIELVSNVVQHATSTTTIECLLDIVAGDDTLSAVLVDTADPPEVDTSPRAMPDEFAESGRGLAFIQALVDDFQYERREDRNVWTIIKIRSQVAP
jgi:serine/threonine-protein kinase RsbW